MSSNRLLELLAEAEGYVSGEWLSEQLGISRTAVWKQINSLKRRGYTFEASPRLGYRLVGRPNVMDIHRLQSLLETRTFGRKLKYLDRVPTTQQTAHEWKQEGAGEGALVLAEQQTAGRGRRGRSWHSPPGTGIWMSLILEPRIHVNRVPQLTLLAAVALCRSLKQTTGLPVGIKWPNDLLIRGRKISGILLESVAEDERLQYVVAGIGINVNQEAEDFPEDLRNKAASLKMEAGRPMDREQLLASFLKEWESLYMHYLKNGFAIVRTLWESYSVTLGCKVEVQTSEGLVSGKALQLDEQGGLRIDRGNGNVTTVYAGEVRFADGETRADGFGRQP